MCRIKNHILGIKNVRNDSRKAAHHAYAWVCRMCARARARVRACVCVCACVRVSERE